MGARWGYLCHTTGVNKSATDKQTDRERQTEVKGINHLSILKMLAALNFFNAYYSETSHV